MSQVGILTDYIEAAMRRAHYRLLDDGTVFGEIAECPGVWANEDHLETCRDELRASLEDWLLLGLKLDHTLPDIDGLALNATPAPA